MLQSAVLYPKMFSIPTQRSHEVLLKVNERAAHTHTHTKVKDILDPFQMFLRFKVQQLMAVINKRDRGHIFQLD